MTDLRAVPDSTGRDAGLFGPASVTWKIHSDPAMVLAGFRALILQATHPLVMAGFDANTSYHDDPWGRLQRTGDWVNMVTFGDTEQAEAAGLRLRRFHAHLSSGIEGETGRPYKVDDPQLLRWVHTTEVESFLSTYRRCGGSLRPGEADQYVREMRQSARLVGLREDDVPGTEAEIADYYDAVRPDLHVTAVARRNVLRGFAPPMPRWVAFATPARPAWATLVGVSAAMLPRWARRLYGLPALPVTDVAATASGRALRRSMLLLPQNGPHQQARRLAEQRLAA